MKKGQRAKFHQTKIKLASQAKEEEKPQYDRNYHDKKQYKNYN